MKKTILAFACAASVFAQNGAMLATPENIAKFDQIVDIRTPSEWAETGIIKGAKTITLNRDKEQFLKDIKAQIDTTKPFAIICRSGGRSAYAIQMLQNDNLNITNLDGGMIMLLNSGYTTTPYQPQ